MFWRSSGTRFERSERHVRIVISAPRKSGGAQLRCLFSMAYGLKAPPVSAPTGYEPATIAKWLLDLPEKSVSTCDLPISDLAGAASASGIQLIGVIRHPFDLFVSNFDVAQQQAARGREDGEGDHAWSVLSGKGLESDVAQEYAASGFASEVKALRDWASQGRIVRYEDVLVDPSAVLTSVSLTLGALTEEQIGHAVSLCPAENVVLSRPGRGRRMPSLPPGSWRERLPANLLHSLRSSYGADVAALGYDAS